MKKILYLFLLLPLFYACNNDDNNNTGENIGTVEGTWIMSDLTADVSTSGSSALSLAANPLLKTALKKYAEMQEPVGYTFASDDTFIAYNNNSEKTVAGSGTYVLSGNSLVLTYSSSTKQSFTILTATTSSLKIKKDYSSSTAYWGAELLSKYTGLSLSSATSTMSYGK